MELSKRYTRNDDDCREGNQASWVRSVSSAVCLLLSSSFTTRITHLISLQLSFYYKKVIFIGAIIGQLSMGFLGDFLSRNNAMACTLLIASISALLSAILPNGNASMTICARTFSQTHSLTHSRHTYILATVYAIIIVCRLFLGVGLGGIYPLSATKAGEDTSSSSATDTNDKVT